MSHRAAIYSVRIRPLKAREKWCLLGDYDSDGTWAGHTIDDALYDFDTYSSDGNIRARYEKYLKITLRNSIGMTILSGRSGVTSVLQKSGEHDFYRTPQHSEAMRSAILFQLPPAKTRGTLVVHAPHGRSCKSIVQQQLRDWFSFLGYIIDLSPVVPANALYEALQSDELKKVTLIKYDPDQFDKFHEAAQWGSDEVGRLELSVVSGRGNSLRPDPIRRFIESPTEENKRQIIEFNGMEFDDVAVTVKMRNRTQRTFYLEAPDRGYAMSTMIEVEEEDEYGATMGELSRELTSVIRDVSEDN